MPPSTAAPGRSASATAPSTGRELNRIRRLRRHLKRSGATDLAAVERLRVLESVHGTKLHLR